MEISISLNHVFDFFSFTTDIIFTLSHKFILFIVEDEGRGRYNLATKVMSNGVEVIIALDKSTLPGSPQLLRVLPTSIRPITLTPSTVTDHMIMMLPHGLQVHTRVNNKC